MKAKRKNLLNSWPDTPLINPLLAHKWTIEEQYDDWYTDTMVCGMCHLVQQGEA